MDILTQQSPAPAGMSAYAATKFAVRGITQAAGGRAGIIRHQLLTSTLAGEWGKHGISVNAYAPGLCCSNLFDGIFKLIPSAGAIETPMCKLALATIRFSCANLFKVHSLTEHFGDWDSLVAAVSVTLTSSTSFLVKPFIGDCSASSGIHRKP